MQALVQTEQLSRHELRASSRPASRRLHDPLARIDNVIGQSLGVDLRLIYGLAAPMLIVVGLIIALVTRPTYVLLASTLVLELAFLYMVVVKILKFLEDTGDDETLTTS